MSLRVLRGKQLNERNAPFLDKTVVRYCAKRDSVVSFSGNCTRRKGTGGDGEPHVPLILLMLLMQCSMQPGAAEWHTAAWNRMQLALKIMEEEWPYIKPALMEGYSV